jgi:hypothetical protein
VFSIETEICRVRPRVEFSTVGLLRHGSSSASNAAPIGRFRFVCIRGLAGFPPAQKTHYGHRSQSWGLNLPIGRTMSFRWCRRIQCRRSRNVENLNTVTGSEQLIRLSDRNPIMKCEAAAGLCLPNRGWLENGDISCVGPAAVSSAAVCHLRSAFKELRYFCDNARAASRIPSESMP